MVGDLTPSQSTGPDIAADAQTAALVLVIALPQIHPPPVRSKSKCTLHIFKTWLQTFTNSQSVMMHSKVLQTAKEYFRKYFPVDGAAPEASLGKKIGLLYGESILDR